MDKLFKTNRKMGRQRQRGQAMLEFALVTPLLLFVSMGIFDFSRALFTYAEASNGLRNALRYGAILGYDSSNPQYLDCEALYNLASNISFDSNNTEITISYRDHSGDPPTDPPAELGKCVGSPGSLTPNISDSNLANGDLIHIDTLAYVNTITPFFPYQLPIRVIGERTLVKNIFIESPHWCGDDVCDIGIEDGTCIDCNTAPTVAIDSPLPTDNIGNSLTITATVVDSPDGDDDLIGPHSLTVRFFHNGSLITCAPAGGNGTTYTCTFNTSAYAYAAHTFTVTGIDSLNASTSVDVIVTKSAACGNSVCEAGETTVDCFQDCGTVTGFSTIKAPDPNKEKCNPLPEAYEYFPALKWNLVSEATSYQLQAECPGCGTPYSYTDILNPNSTTSLCTGSVLPIIPANYFRPICFSGAAAPTTLWSSTNYSQSRNYRIRAFNGTDYGPWATITGYSCP